MKANRTAKTTTTAFSNLNVRIAMVPYWTSVCQPWIALGIPTALSVSIATSLSVKMVFMKKTNQLIANLVILACLLQNVQAVATL